MSADWLYDRLFKKQLDKSFAHQDSDGRYVELLKFEGSGIQLCPEGLLVLEQASGPIGVFAVTGPSKTGRTSLLNLLLKRPDLNRPDLLAEGTTGLWIYSRPVLKGEVEVYAIDSQGFGSRDLDKQLMTVLYVMCSVFIFNSIGMIDESSMKKLGVIRELPKLIQQADKGSVDLKPAQLLDSTKALKSLAPTFVWTLRDFSLNLTDEHGRPVSGKDYLESVLETGHVQSDYTEAFKHTSDTLCSLFIERDCVRFQRPLDDGSMEFDMSGPVSPKFMRQLDKLHAVAVSQCRSKKFFGQTTNGPLLSLMIQQVVKVLVGEERLDFKKCWNIVKETEYIRVLEEVKQYYIAHRDFDAELMPYDENDLVLKLHRAKEDAVMSLRKSFVKDQRFEDRLIEEFDSYFETDLKFTLEGNVHASIEYNTILLDKVFSSIFERMESGYYSENFNEVDADWEVAAQNYEDQARGPGRFQALSSFGYRFQNERLSKFFKGMLHSYEDKLLVTQRESQQIKERRKAAEEDLRKLNLDDEGLKNLMEEIETKINGSTNEDMPADQRLEIVIEWLKTSDERKRDLEEQRKLAEEEHYKATVVSKRQVVVNKPQNKSCCSIF